MHIHKVDVIALYIYYCFLPTDHALFKYQKVRICVRSGTITWKRRPSQGHPSLPEGHGGQMTRSKWRRPGQGEWNSFGIHSKYPGLLCGFQQSRYFQKNSNGDSLDVKTLTNSRSSHLLLYSFLPRCYCKKLAVKFNWFRIFWIHMATNPGAEAAIAPHCCSPAFASPLVPRWWE